MYKIILALAVAAIVLGGGLLLLTGNASPSAQSAATTTDSFAYSLTSPLASSTPAATTSAQSSITNQGTTNNQAQVMQATLHTSMGDITIEFDSAAPNTVANFVKLAQSGFYSGVKFHRVIGGFMDQAGDPLTKDDSKAAQWGTGGPGYTIPDENMSAHNAVGTVVMANTGQPGSGGSQFFINAAENTFLDGKYAVFGKVVAGLDVALAINKVQTDSSDKPLTPVVINSVTLK